MEALDFQVQWNLVITRSDITKSSYNEVILLVQALYISLFFYPDIMRNLIQQGNFHGPKDLVIKRFHCTSKDENQEIFPDYLCLYDSHIERFDVTSCWRIQVSLLQ